MSVGYAVLCGVFVLLPLFTVTMIWRGISLDRETKLLASLVSPEQVEERLARDSGRRRQMLLACWEYVLELLASWGRAPAEIAGLVANRATFAGLVKQTRRMGWAQPGRAKWIWIIASPFIVMFVWVGLFDMSAGDAAGFIFLALGVLPAVWAFRLTRAAARSTDAETGRRILPLLAASPEDRRGALHALAEEHVAVVRAARRAEQEAGFSTARQTVTENTESTARSSQKAWIDVLLAGGALSFFRLAYQILEYSGVTAGIAVPGAIGVTAVATVLGFAGWRVWYRSSAGRRRLLRTIGAVPADRETYRPSWRALEQVSAAAGSADPPLLFVMRQPVVNAAVTGLSVTESAFLITEWFAQLPEAEQQAAFAHLMAHVVSGRAAKAAAPRRQRLELSDPERQLLLQFSASDEIEGLQLTRAPRAHIALLERLIRSDVPYFMLGWVGQVSPFADRRLWYYAPPLAGVSSMRMRLEQLRGVLGAEAIGEVHAAPPAPSAEAEQPADDPRRPAHPGHRRRGASPSAEAIAMRAAALIVAAERAFAEATPADDAAPHEAHAALVERVEALRAWAQESGAASVFTTPETALMDSEPGQAAEQLVYQAIWALEGVPMLVWAIRGMDEVPAWDRRCERAMLPDALAQRDAEALREFAAEAELRADEEMQLVWDAADSWWWRAWMGELQADGAEPPQGRPYEEAIAEAAEMLAAEGLLTPLGDDFPAYGMPYRDLPEQERFQIRNIAWQRYRALLWLLGEQAEWDPQPEDEGEAA